MIFVSVIGVKPGGQGTAGGGSWLQVDDVEEAVAAALRSYRRMWNPVYGEAVTYRIEVATEASPRRAMNGRPLPVWVEDEAT